jgi:predicted ArsR family transcriptional regulator
VRLTEDLDAAQARISELETEINEGGVAARDTIHDIIDHIDQRFQDDDLVELIDGLVTIARQRGVTKEWRRLGNGRDHD